MSSDSPNRSVFYSTLVDDAGKELQWWAIDLHPFQSVYSHPPDFQSLALGHLTFTKYLHQGPFLLTESRPNRTLAFVGKRRKAKITAKIEPSKRWCAPREQ